jgi:hypothetical protein
MDKLKKKILHDLRKIAGALSEQQDAAEKIKFAVYGLIKDLDEVGEVVTSPHN